MTTLTATSVPAELGNDQASGLALRTRGLTKRYGDRAVVDRVDLEVPPGGTRAVLTLRGHRPPPPGDQGIERDQGK